MNDLTRRKLIFGALAGAGAGLAAPYLGRVAAAPLAVIGSGPAGLAAALNARRLAPDLPITLIERDPTRLAGQGAAFAAPRPPLDLGHLKAAGIDLLLDDVTGADYANKRLTLLSGRTQGFSTLVMAAGASARPETMPGLDARARHLWPAAWGSAREARRLASQLGAMPDGGHVVLRLPEDAAGNPRALAGRVAAVASGLDRTHPTARLTVLDSDPAGRVRRMSSGIPGMVWIGPREGSHIRSVDATKGRIDTDAGLLTADVVNFIPPQGAADIARLTGLVDESGWCPCDGNARSTRAPDVILAGDLRRSAARGLIEAETQGADCVTALS